MKTESVNPRSAAGRNNAVALKADNGKGGFYRFTADELLRINVEKYDEGCADFITMTNKKCIGWVSDDSFNAGKYIGRCAKRFGIYGRCTNATFSDAVKFIKDCIERHFTQFGIKVEFVEQ